MKDWIDGTYPSEKTIDPHDCDGDPDKPCSIRGYSKPITKNPVKIYRCMIEEELKIRTSNVTETIKLWFDTMASHSITSDLRMFGNTGPDIDCKVWVASWDTGQDRKLITRCGITAFGIMLYDAEACGTLISGYEAYETCDVEWTRGNHMENIVTTYGEVPVKVHFSATKESRVLEGEISIEEYGILRSQHSSRIRQMTSEVNIKAFKVDSAGFRRALEVMYAHRMTGHVCTSYLSKTAEMHILSNMPFNACDCHNLNRISEGTCPCCAVAKSKSTSMNPARRWNSFDIGLPILPDADKCWPANTSTREENVGFDHMFIDQRPILVAVGQNFNYVHVIPMTHGRKGKYIKAAIQLVIDDYEKHGIEVKELTNARLKQPEGIHRDVVKIMMDNEAGFIQTVLHEFDSKYKIHHAFVVPGEHVSFVERTIQTLKTRVAAVRVSLPFVIEGKLLSWLVGNVAMWMNILYSKRAPDSAWKNMMGSTLNYRDLSRTTFGDVVMAHQPKIVYKHGEPHGELGLSLGPNPRQPGAIFFYGFKTKRVKSRIRFKTNISMSAVPELGKNPYVVEGDKMDLSFTTYLKKRSADEVQNYFANRPDKMDEAPREGSGTTEPIGPDFMQAADQPIDKSIPIIETQDADATEVEAEAQMMAMWLDTECRINAARSSVTSTNISWKKALGRTGEPGEKAHQAIHKELKQIVLEYDVCCPVDKHKQINNCHLSHALFDTAKDKARLVIGKKIHDMVVDYGIDTSSPTINGKIISMMLSICIHAGLDLEVWDVKGAFLKANLAKKGVFVRLDKMVTSRTMEVLKQEDPIKHETWMKEVRSDGTLMVEVQKGWYGLPAASALWYQEISTTLIDIAGYTRHAQERCLFYKRLDNGKTAYILLHVDDLGIMIHPGSPEWKRVRDIMEAKYEQMSIKTGDKVKYIGLELERNRDKNRFEIRMTEYLAKLAGIHEVDTTKCNEKNPADSLNFKNEDYDGIEDEFIHDEEGRLLYRSLVMSMQYGNWVVPSVKYHVIHLATRQAHPKKGDYQKALRVLRYMYTKRMDAVHIYGIGDGDIIIYVYTDAAFDVYRDSISHSGMSIFIGEAGGAIYCHSNKQKCVTRSSTEAEIVAAIDGLDIAQYYRAILNALGYKATVIHYEDNMSSMSLISTGCYAYDKKDRHIVRKINYMHEYFEDKSNEATMVWCPTHLMLGDLMTKDMHGSQFSDLESVTRGITNIDLKIYEKKRVKKGGLDSDEMDIVD